MEFKYYFYKNKENYLMSIDTKIQLKFEINSLVTVNNRNYTIVALSPLKINSYKMAQDIYLEETTVFNNHES